MPKLNILNVAERTGTADSRAVSLSIKDIPIGEISVKENVRKEYDGIDELKASIRRYGLLQPSTVYKDGDTYSVKTGHRRFLAFKELYDETPDRFHSVRCVISDAANIPVIQLVENVQRLDLSDIDLFNALNILKEQGSSLKQIADVLGKTENYVKKIFTGINEIKQDPELKAYIGSAGGTIQDILETSGIPNKEDRLSLLEQRKAGVVTRAQMRKQAKALKGVPSQSPADDSSAGGTTQDILETSGIPSKEDSLSLLEGCKAEAVTQTQMGEQAGALQGIPLENPDDSSAGGTIQNAIPPGSACPVRLSADKEQRRITLSFDDDEQYALVHAALKSVLDKHHLVCIEQEADNA
jgi:ParB family chromosome partitioning protein